MEKLKTDVLVDVIKERDELRAEKKAAAAKVFKLKQKLDEYFKETDKLRRQLAGANRDDSPIVHQLKEEARQLRLEVTNLKKETLQLQRERDAFKAERDNALVQLKKSPIEPAAAALPAS